MSVPARSQWSARLTTQRLSLRPRQRSDVDAQVALDSDPEISIYSDIDVLVRTTGRNPSQVRKKIKAEIAAGSAAPGGVWAIEWKEQPGFLGICGLQPFAMTRSMTLFFRVVRSAWGQGIATEAARAVLAHGLAALNLPTITALVHPDNRRSRRVVEKIGLRYEGLLLVGPQSILNPKLAPAANRFGLLGLPTQQSYSNRYLCFRLHQGEYAKAVDETQPRSPATK